VTAESFESILAVLDSESDFEVLSHILVPARLMFRALKSDWALIDNFVKGQKDIQKVVVILDSFLPSVSKEQIRENARTLVDLIGAVFESVDCVAIAWQLFGMDAFIGAALEQPQQAELIEMFAERFGQLLVELVNGANDSILTNVAQVLCVTFAAGYSRFHFQSVIGPLVSKVADSQCALERRLTCAEILGGLLEHSLDEVAEDDLFEIIDVAVELAPLTEISERGDDSALSEPLRLGTLLTGCFSRLSKGTIATRVYDIYRRRLSDNPIGAVLVLEEAVAIAPCAFADHRYEILRDAFMMSDSPSLLLRSWIIFLLNDFHDIAAPVIRQDPVAWVTTILGSSLSKVTKLQLLSTSVAVLDDTTDVFQLLMPIVFRGIGEIERGTPENILMWALLGFLTGPLHNDSVSADLWSLAVSNMQPPDDTAVSAGGVLIVVARRWPDFARTRLDEVVGWFVEVAQSDVPHVAIEGFSMLQRLIELFGPQMEAPALSLVSQLLQICNAIHEDADPAQWNRFVGAALQLLAALVTSYPTAFIGDDIAYNVIRAANGALKSVSPDLFGPGCQLLIAIVGLFTDETCHILAQQIEKWYEQLLNQLWCDQDSGDDYELDIQIGKALCAICELQRFALPTQLADEIVGKSLAVLHSTRRKHTGEFMYMPRLYEVFENLIQDIVMVVEGPWVERFFGTMFLFYLDGDPRVRRVAVNLFRVLISRPSSVAWNGFLDQIMEGSVSVFSENILESIPDHCQFLAAVWLATPIAPDPELFSAIHARLSDIQDPNGLMEIIARENLVALLCTFERKMREPIMEGDLLGTVLASLPAKHDLEVNNYVYAWLIWRVKISGSSPFLGQILRLLVVAFSHRVDVIGISFRRRREVWGVLISLNGTVRQYDSEIFQNEEERLMFNEQMEIMRKVIAQQDHRAAARANLLPS
jgi:hypothetical protein